MQPPADLVDDSSPPVARDQEIVLVGASVRSAAESARRAAYRVIGIDLFGDTDTRKACQRHIRLSPDLKPGVIEDVVREKPVFKVGGLHAQGWSSHLLAELGDRLVGVHAGLSDPGYLGELATRTPMRFPETLTRGGGTSARGGRWLHKEYDSCGGLGTTWKAPLQSPDANGYLQRWVGGRTLGATLLCDGAGATLLGVCRALFTRKANRPFVYSGSVGPVPVAAAVGETLAEAAALVSRDTGLRGLLNIDFVLDGNGQVWLLEINPRWSGSTEIIERWLLRHGRLNEHDSLMARMIRAQSQSNGRKIDGATGQVGPPTYLKRIVWARDNLKFARAKIALEPGESLHDVPADGTVISRGDPVCTVVREISDMSEANVRRVREIVRNMNQSLSVAANDNRQSISTNHSPRSSAYE